MVRQLVNAYLEEQGYQMTEEAKVFEELDSMQFVGLLAMLNQHAIEVNLTLFTLETDSTLLQLIQWLESFSKGN